MHSSFQFRHGALALGILLASAGAQAQVAGLSGAYYAFSSFVNNNATAEAWISVATPTATFVATTICYPSCSTTADDSVSLRSFLGSNATGLSNDSVSNLKNHVLTLTGYLNIASTGSYTFGLGSDDGSKLEIDGMVLSNDGDHGFSTVTATYALDAGLHSIRVLQFEDGGSTGLTVTMNGVALDSSVLQTAAVPEPASWALLAGGLGLVGWRRRQTARHSA